MKQRVELFASGRARGRVACALLLLASVASAQEPPPAGPPPPEPPSAAEPLPDELWAELDAYAASLLAPFDVPGAAVALVRGGQIERVSAHGVRGVDDPVPVDGDTRFMIGSLTKSMTTTLAAALVSEGRLDWDEPVSGLLPDFAVSNPEWTPLVRMRDVLGHTSGVPRFDVMLFVDSDRPLELIARIADIPALAPPGERFDYQNQVFAVGGFALARAAGAANRSGDIARTYQRLMNRRVFRPLGMTRTTLDFDAAIRDDNHAAPHALDPATSVASPVSIGFERFTVPAAPAGGVWSSITDMARYLAMHVREGESVDGVRVVSAAELEETHTAQTVLEGSTGYGLGWGVSVGANGTVLAHAGGTAGFASQFVGLPSIDYGFVILTNSVDGGWFITAVARYLTELVFGLPHRGDADLLAGHAAQEAAFAGILAGLAPVDAESVADHLGRYERRVQVSHDGDDLVVETVYDALRFQRVPEAEGLFVCTTNFFVGALAQLATDEHGRRTLSLGFQLESGTLVNPLVVARLGDASPPRHPGHPHRRDGRRQASHERRTFDWNNLSGARRWSNARRPLDHHRRSWPGLD
jgi:CubicO group peptidase (beta-lactamase class C family)